MSTETQPAQRAADREGTETVLVVDERPAVAETASMILDDFGYTTLIAPRLHSNAPMLAVRSSRSS